MTEMTVEKPVVKEPELPEIATARLLMGKRGSRRFNVPEYFDLAKNPEFQPFIDREHSNGVIYLNFTDASVAGRYLHLKNKAAEEFIKSNRLKI